ncbi:LamG-like jellyroll fold domain-containing protein [Micromonospora sp. NPDC050187]|uniref:LamG-like jellyroll fold domain-containing protein n=1 Tax=Micromonospora sp. NPDC050187 TaxID=3364277 RepID=UPI00379A0CC8
MSAALLLHWQLDDLAAGPLVTGSPAAPATGEVEGSPQVRADERFGSCLALAGGSDAVVSTSGVTRPITSMAWVRVPPMPSNSMAVVFGQWGHFVLWLHDDGRIGYEGSTVNGPFRQETVPGTFTFDRWHHLAVTSQDSTARILLDGVVVAEDAMPGPTRPSGERFALGRNPNSVSSHLALTAAHLRVYDAPRSVAEIQRDMAGDEALLATFVRTHPLAFELVNVDDQPVLYIDDAPAGQTLTLRVTNSSRQDLTLWSTSGPTGPENHHLAVTFRQGVLAADSRPALEVPGWELTLTGSTGWLRGPEGLTLPAGNSLDLRLTGLRADGVGGTRGSRVELGYQRMGYSGEPSELTGARHQVLEIVNHRGRPDVPLHLGFVGGDRVLSDGRTPGDLRVRVANVSREIPVPLTGADGTAPTELVLSFEVQGDRETRDWALTTAGTAGTVTLRVGGSVPGVWQVHREMLADRAQWTLIPQQDTTLPPGGCLELTLEEVQGLPDPGHAPVVLAYRNLPGFQDGQLSAAVERAPLVFSARNAGLGTATPQSRLHIVDDNGDANGGSVIVGPTDQPNLRLGYDTGYAWVQSHGSAPLAVNPVGNKVGIGTTAPASPLTVQAVSEHLQLRREAQSGGGVVFLELYQDQTPAGVDVYPSIRFHHSHRFWHRIEGRPEGFAFKQGASDELTDVQTGALTASAVTTGALTASTVTTPRLRAEEVHGAQIAAGQSVFTAGSDHLQLRREDQSGGGVLFLELYQAETPDGVDVHPSIRFHHSHRFWHRIEGRPEGFAFKQGGSDDLSDVRAARGTFQALTVDGVTIGAHELRALLRLAAGELEFDLYNVLQGEFAYAADFSPFDNDRRHVFTWRRKGERVSQGRWRIAFPS